MGFGLRLGLRFVTAVTVSDRVQVRVRVETPIATLQEQLTTRRIAGSRLVPGPGLWLGLGLGLGMGPGLG